MAEDESSDWGLFTWRKESLLFSQKDDSYYVVNGGGGGFTGQVRRALGMGMSRWEGVRTMGIDS